MALTATWVGRAASLPPTKGHFVSRLWSRFGARTAAVALLSVGVAGGFYLGEDRQTQQQGLTAQVGLEVDQAEYAYQRERLSDHQRGLVPAACRRVPGEAACRRGGEGGRRAGQKAEAAAAPRKKERERKPAESEAQGQAVRRADPGLLRGVQRQPEDRLRHDARRGLRHRPVPLPGQALDQGERLEPKASNSSSGAYGIPQALPGSKMGSVADDWKTNPATQIKWGLGYIKGRYDTPCGAWQKSQSSGWY